MTPPARPIPYTHPTDCPAFAFDASLSVPSAATRPGAAAPAAGKPEGPRPARQPSLLEIDR
jgi:hypothetical protein